jgi:hypothetical protein
MKFFLKIFCLTFITLHSLCSSSIRAEERLIGENQAKAAFVFNVVRYVNWPPPDSDTVLIGVLGKGSLAGEWQSISGKSLNGKKIKVFKSNDIDEMFECQIVFIEETNHQKLSRILLLLKNYPILSIGDSPVFINSGGMLYVYLTNNRISFTVNLTQSRVVGLNISSNLLKLASEVIK